MQIKAIYLTCFLGLFSSLLWAAPSTAPTPVPLVIPKTPETSHPSNKQAWIAHMEKSLPQVLCQEDQYFVRCFQTNQQECLDFTKLLVEACLNNAKLALPEEITTQGEHWGQMIGRCSYDLYEKFMQSKKRQIPECQSLTPPNTPTPKP